MGKYYLYMLFLILFSPAIFAASFDCAKVGHEAEKLICADEKISMLDEELAKAYKKALEAAVDRVAIKKTQITWLKQQRECKDSECLMQSYQVRINELNQITLITATKDITRADNEVESLAQSGVSVKADGVRSAPSGGFMLDESKYIKNQKFPLKFKLVYGDSYPICQPYVDMLNATKYMEYPACERKILPEFTQFKMIEWIEITDKQEMKKIMEENITFYFKGNDNKNTPQMMAAIKREKNAIENNLVRLYRAEFDLDSNGTIEIIYKEVGFRKDAKNFNACEHGSGFYVRDKDININDDVYTKYLEKGYGFLNGGGDADLLFVNEKIYKSWWSGRNYKYDITLNKNDKYRTEICGIEIQ